MSLSLAQWMGGALVLLGIPFFVSGTVGLLRFPDVYSRLHALTKVDNLGLGFIVLGVSVQTNSLGVVVKLWLIYGLVLAASTTSCHLIARTALERSRERVP